MCADPAGIPDIANLKGLMDLQAAVGTDAGAQL